MKQTQAEATRWLGISERAVRELERRLPPLGAARHAGDWQAYVRGALAHYRELAAGRTGGDAGRDLARERAALAREQAEAQAMKNAVTRGELMSAAETEATMVAVATTIRAALLAFESKLAPALDGAETIVERAAVIREHVYEVLSQLAALGDELQRSTKSDDPSVTDAGSPPKRRPAARKRKPR